MTESFVSRGFRGRRQPAATAGRLPPGQYETRDFPVLSAGPTPRTAAREPGTSLCVARVDRPRAGRGTNSRRCRTRRVKTDIHCVTKWSKFDTVWEGVSVDTLLAEAAARGVRPAPYVLARIRRRLHHEPAARGRDRRQGMGGGRIRRRAARARARRPCAPARAAPLLLEEREVGAAAAPHGARRGRILGVVRLSQLRRPVA